MAYILGLQEAIDSGVWRWIGDLELYYNPEFCKVFTRVGGVISGQTFKFGAYILGLQETIDSGVVALDRGPGALL